MRHQKLGSSEFRQPLRKALFGLLHPHEKLMNIARRALTSTTSIRVQGYQTASEKLFADAAKEEEERLQETKAKLEQRLLDQTNWTGEESTQDAVLRMLVDKYKTRGPIIPADERLKRNPPSVAATPINLDSNLNKESKSAIAPEDHKPWLTTFKAPSFAVHPAVRAMRLPPQSATKPAKLDEVDKVKGPTREERLRLAQANRLVSAREGSLDYRFGGVKPNSVSHEAKKAANPVSVKGWMSLVEERIEMARQSGAFKNLKGRGKPAEQDIAEHNPFISGEEFLVNRMVQRNGAAPPWVELQRDLENHVSSFRDVLQTAWVKRAVRTIPLANLHDPDFMTRINAESLSRMRDKEWEEKEKAYHEAAIAEINSIVRSYNGVAPFFVRRGYHSREGELERCYATSGSLILAELNLRQNSPTYTAKNGDLEAEQMTSSSAVEWQSLWFQVIASIRSLFRL